MRYVWYKVKLYYKQFLKTRTQKVWVFSFIYSPIVKWLSRLTVNQLFQVRVLVGEQIFLRSYNGLERRFVKARVTGSNPVGGAD